MWKSTRSRLVSPSLLVNTTLIHFLVSLWGFYPGSVAGSYPSQAWETQEWIEYPDNPVLPNESHSEETGTVFDLSLWEENMTSTGVPADLYFREPTAAPVDTALTWRMWNSWRPARAIAYSTSQDGKVWNQTLQRSLESSDSGWEADVNRPFVKKIAAGKYAMWYTGQNTGAGVGGRIGYAESTDGVDFHRTQDQPVLVPSLPWELSTVMTPTLIDLPDGRMRMYYSAGEAYEPDAIGVAHSIDGGLTWAKHGDPVFKPDHEAGGEVWDSYKVTSPHVIRDEDGYFYMLYAGFRNIDYAAIGLARSKNGLTDWERHIGNPIVDRRQDAWNCDAVYKPFLGWSEAQQEWLLWYNGRCGPLERIGLSVLKSETKSLSELFQSRN